jgi:hypothetical protein
MKYVCLVYLDDEHHLDGLSQRERADFINEVLDNDDRLRQAGHRLEGHALALPREAMTVRVRQGQLSATDGPFLETKEHLSGFIVIEARDLNDAIRIGGTLPMARHGAVEVRPVRYIERQ